MISAFLALGLVLLAVPLFYAIFVMISKSNQKKRANDLANATTTKTTLKKGPNGRTVFQATTTRPSPASSPPRDPVLPFTQQQAARSARASPSKSTWKRLSRPFSMAYAAFDNHSIELNPLPKKRPDSCSNRSQQHLTSTPEDLVSPVTPQQQHWAGRSSSWNTIDGLDSSPISPFSVTGGRSSSSKPGTAYIGYHDHQSIRSEQAAAGPAMAGAYAAREKVQLSLPPKAKVARR